jgi:hypothetical protein
MNRGYGPAWLAPLTGALFVVVLIVGFTIMGEPKDAEDPVEEIVQFYADNQDEVQVGALLGVLGGALLITFAAYLRSFLRGALGDDAITPTLAFIGPTIVAIGIAIDGTISFALAESADNIEPSAVQALQALWDNDFLPFILGVAVYLLGTGLAILRSGALPKWIGWVMLLALVLGFTPIGWVAAIVAGLSVLVISVMLTMRARRETPAPAA